MLRSAAVRVQCPRSVRPSELPGPRPAGPPARGTGTASGGRAGRRERKGYGSLFLRGASWSRGFHGLFTTIRTSQGFHSAAWKKVNRLSRGRGARLLARRSAAVPSAEEKALRDVGARAGQANGRARPALPAAGGLSAG